MNTESLWFAISLVGLAEAIAFTMDAHANLKMAIREGWGLQRLMSRGQKWAGFFLVQKFILSVWLGWLAVTDSTLIRQVATPVLFLDNLSVVLALGVMWYARYRVYHPNLSV